MADGKRVYRSSLRAEQARRTRALVVDAAATCFLRSGYAGATMKEIAAEAGVALQTVFAQGGKSALLLAVVDRAVAGDDDDRPVLERDPLRELLEIRDRAPKLALLRDLTLAWQPVAAPVLRVFRDAAATDPEVAAAWTEYEDRRYRDLTRLVASFAHLLRDGLRVERATDVLWAVASTETADNLVVARGWTTEAYADWFADTVDRLLLRVENGPRG